MRGIYVDADDDIDQTARTHAVRIARYLYPIAYLSAASAVLLGPTRDGRLFLTGRGVQRQRIKTLEIIQNKAPDRSRRRSWNGQASWRPCQPMFC